MSYHQPSNNTSRSPSPTPQQSRQHHFPLQIRTAQQPAQPAMQQQQQQQDAQAQASSQEHRPHPIYPIPIPQDKLDRALKLYRDYLLAERIAQSPSGSHSHHGYHLEIPGGSSAHSVTSRASSRRDRSMSVATSNVNAEDSFSVVSFEGAQSPGSVRQGEPINYNGERVRLHHRNRLNPKQKAKAALIRYIGSCWVCRGRRVPCPLEHHDIEALKTLDRQRSTSQRQRRSSNLSASQPAMVSTPVQQPSQSLQIDTSFLGLGTDVTQTQQNTNYSTTLTELDLNVNTPTLIVRQPTSLILGSASVAPAFNPDPYSTFADGRMLALGVFRSGTFICQCLTICNQTFADAEELQSHWELEHFPYNRINPCFRFICSSCNHMSNDMVSPCYNPTCPLTGRIELWVYGAYIRTASIRPERPDGRDTRLIYGSASSTNWSSPYIFGNIDSQFGSNMDGSMDDPSFDGNITPGNSNYDFGSDPGSGGYGGPSTRGYSFDPFNFQSTDTGSGYFDNQSMLGLKSLAIKSSLFRALHVLHRLKTTLLLMILLTVIMLTYTHDYIIDHAHAHLPVVGVLGIIISFIANFTFKLISRHHYHHTRVRPAKSHHCPLHTITHVPCGVKRSRHQRHGLEAHLGAEVYS